MKKYISDKINVNKIIIKYSIFTIFSAFLLIISGIYFQKNIIITVISVVLGIFLEVYIIVDTSKILQENIKKTEQLHNEIYKMKGEIFSTYRGFSHGMNLFNTIEDRVEMLERLSFRYPFNLYKNYSNEKKT